MTAGQAVARHLFVTGTDTDVGKTMVTSALAAGLAAAGHGVRALKPLATGGAAPGDDARLLGLGAGHAPWVHRCLPTPASPERAALIAGVEIDPTSLEQAVRAEMAGAGVALVEGVGGWEVPITASYRVSDLARSLAFPVVVVAANRLGVLSHTLLTADAVRASGLALVGVVLNDGAPGATLDPDLAAWNHADLQRQGLSVWRFPSLAPPTPDTPPTPQMLRSMLARAGARLLAEMASRWPAQLV